MEIESTSFVSLLKSFIDLHGGDSAECPEGDMLEFVAENNFIAMVLPHPINSELCIIEIQIRHLNLENPSESSQALLMMHRINNTARLEKEWVTAIDENNMLLLAIMLPIASLNVDILGEEIADGLQRAESINELWMDGHERGTSPFKEENTIDSTPMMHLPLDCA